MLIRQEEQLVVAYSQGHVCVLQDMQVTEATMTAAFIAVAVVEVTEHIVLETESMRQQHYVLVRCKVHQESVAQIVLRSFWI